MALFTSVASGIAALSVSGVTIKDTSETTDAIDARECPVLAPAVANFVTNFDPRRESFGLNNEAAITIEYDLTYTLYYMPAGSERTLAVLFDGLLKTVAAIFEAALTEIGGAVDVLPKDIRNTGADLDPTGREFIGYQVVFRVTEFRN